MPATGGAQLQIRDIGTKFRGSALKIRLVPNCDPRSPEYPDRGGSGIVITQAADLIAFHIALFPPVVLNILIETNASAARRLCACTSNSRHRDGLRRHKNRDQRCQNESPISPHSKLLLPNRRAYMENGGLLFSLARQTADYVRSDDK